jgi:peroxiredoxin
MTPDVGDLAPDFELRESSGAPQTLTALVAGGARVLIFYRGHW